MPCLSRYFTIIETLSSLGIERLWMGEGIGGSGGRDRETLRGQKMKKQKCLFEGCKGAASVVDGLREKSWQDMTIH